MMGPGMSPLQGAEKENIHDLRVLKLILATMWKRDGKGHVNHRELLQRLRQQGRGVSTMSCNKACRWSDR